MLPVPTSNEQTFDRTNVRTNKIRTREKCKRIYACLFIHRPKLGVYPYVKQYEKRPPSNAISLTHSPRSMLTRLAKASASPKLSKLPNVPSSCDVTLKLSPMPNTTVTTPHNRPQCHTLEYRSKPLWAAVAPRFTEKRISTHFDETRGLNRPSESRHMA